MRDGVGWAWRRAVMVGLAVVLAAVTTSGGVAAGMTASGASAARTPSGASAARTPSGASAARTPSSGELVCQLRDARLTEISGMVATNDGFVVVNDGVDDESRLRIFFLDHACAVVRTVRYPSRPRDTEDLAVGADGTIWVADIGDNDRDRATVAVWKLPLRAARPVLYRVAYPDRPHDAEAMLVTGDGRPLIVTKHSGVLYAPTGPLLANATVPLARLGQVRLPHTTTSNPFSFLGRTVITGAAAVPGRQRVLLRTYADAFEYDVSDGDVVKALTTGTPRVVALPDEPQGESVTYSDDGRSIFTVSERVGQARPMILRYAAPSPGDLATPAAAIGTPTASTGMPTGASEAATGPGDATQRGAAGRRDDIQAGVVVAGVLGAGLVSVAVLLGLVRFRRSARR